jgi:hypothetical protein
MQSTPFALFAVLTLAAGCASDGGGLSRKLKVETQPSPQAQFSTPSVHQGGEVLRVAGTVRLAQLLNDDGRHIHLDFYDADGEPIDLVEADLTPNADNPKDLHSAAYNVNYFFNAPPGTTMTVSVAEAQCWLASGSGDTKRGSLADYNQSGSKAKTIAKGYRSGDNKPEYRQTNRVAKPRGFRSPGYRRSGSSRRR